VPLASFLSSILSNRDNEAFILGALQIVELLLGKMPTVYTRSFHREGVFFEIEKLAKEELSASAKSSQRQQQSKDKSAVDTPLQDRTPSDHADVKNQDPSGLSRRHPSQTLAATSISSGSRKVSSVPSDPHDVNIVRARILCIKADLGTKTKGDDKQEQSPAASIVKSLGEPDISAEAFRDLMRRVATLLTDKEEPLSSFELLKSGLLDKLMELIVNAETDIVKDRRHILYEVLSDGGGETSALVILIKRLQESLSRMENFEVESASSGLEESKGSSLRLVAEDGTDLPRVCKEMVVSVQAIAPLSAINSWLRSRVVSISNGGSGAANGLSSMLEAAYASRYDNQNGGPRNPPASRKTGTNMDSTTTGGVAASHQKQSGSADNQSSRRRSERLRGNQPSENASHPDDSKDAAVSAPADQSTVGDGNQRAKDKIQDSAVKPDDAVIHDSADEDGDDDNDDNDDDGEGEDGDSDMDDDYDDVIFEDDMDDDMQDDIDRPQEQTVDLSLPEDGSKPEATTPSGTRVATPTNGTSAAESSKTADLPPKLGSYAAAVRAPPTDWHFQFLIGTEELSMADTVYGALHRNQTASTDGKPKQSIFWQQPVIKFRKVEGPAPAVGIQSAAPAPVEPASTSVLPSTLPVDSAQATVLRMLRVLHALNTERQDSGATGNIVDEAVFINAKLTAKFARQLEELVIVASNCLPDWAMDLPTHFPFLFPFEARYTYLQSTSFGYSRLISKWMAQQGPSESNRRLGMLDALPRVQRSRVRISRSKILESAARVMELYGASPGVLEIEYQDEEGTGLGPTLEFYTLVSRAFAERKLGLWRDDDESITGPYVHHPRGLFPRPIAEKAGLQHTTKSDYPLFKSLGTFVGKALLDSRIIDINFNKVFLRAVMGETLPLDLATLRQVDPNFARTMEKFQEIIEQKLAIQNDEALSEADKTERILALRLDGAELEDLGLDFVLPGDPSIELRVSLAGFYCENTIADDTRFIIPG
jgi:E3 ubiquitin-protein ligase TRIP12